MAMSELTVILHESAQQPHSGYSSRITDRQWNQVKPTVVRMFEEGKTKKEIVNELRSKHSFQTSMSQLVTRMMRWLLMKQQARQTTHNQTPYSLTRSSAMRPAIHFIDGCLLDAPAWFSESILSVLRPTYRPLIPADFARTKSRRIDMTCKYSQMLAYLAYLLRETAIDNRKHRNELEGKMLKEARRSIAVTASSTTKEVPGISDTPLHLAIYLRFTAFILLYMAYMSCRADYGFRQCEFHMLGFSSFCATYGLNASNQPVLYRAAAQLDLYIAQQSKKPPVLGLNFEQSQLPSGIRQSRIERIKAAFEDPRRHVKTSKWRMHSELWRARREAFPLPILMQLYE